MVEERHKHVDLLLDRQQQICKDLGRKTKDFATESLPSTAEILEFEQYLANLELEKFTRTEKFLCTKNQILKLVQEYNIKPSVDFEREVLSEDDTLFAMTDLNMKLLEDYYSSLKQQCEEIKSKVEHVRKQIETIWTDLDENIEYRDQFRNMYTGTSLDTLASLQDELNRCQALRKENIQVCIFLDFRILLFVEVFSNVDVLVCSL